MAKNAVKNPNTPSPMYPIPPKEFTPEWFEANRENFEKAGVTFVSKAQLKREAEKETVKVEAAEAVKELLGVDPDEMSTVHEQDEHQLMPIMELILQTKKYIDLIRETSQYRSLMSDKERMGLYWVRVFIRQLLNEKPPPHQAGSLREMVGPHAKIPDGVLAARGSSTVRRKQQERKQIRLGPEHLEAAGIGV